VTKPKFHVWRAAMVSNRTMLLISALIPIFATLFIWFYRPDISHLSQTGGLSVPDAMSVFSKRRQMTKGLVQLLPVINALFFGATLYSRIYERGTFRFYWTQGAGRRKYARATTALFLAVNLFGAFLIGTAFDVRWGFNVQNKLNAWMGQVTFDTSVWQGNTFYLVPEIYVAFSALFFATALLIGTVIKRVIPAMGLTVVLVGTVFSFFPTFYEQTVERGLHILVSNDPLEDDTSLEKIFRAERARSESVANSALDLYVLMPGFVKSDGTFRQYDGTEFMASIGSDSQPAYLSGAAYDKRFAKLGDAFIRRWRAPDDFPKYRDAYSVGLGGTAALLIGANQLWLRRRR